MVETSHLLNILMPCNNQMPQSFALLWWQYLFNGNAVDLIVVWDYGRTPPNFLRTTCSPLESVHDVFKPVVYVARRKCHVPQVKLYLEFKLI